MTLKMIAMTLLLTFSACKKNVEYTVGEIEDQPETVHVERTNLDIEAPAFGVVEGGQIQVSVEASDSSRLMVGEKAAVYLTGSRKKIDCVVSRVLKNVSEETGQSLAWLSGREHFSLPQGDFVESWITLAVKRNVLSVPRASVFIRDGKTWIIKKVEKPEKNKPEFVPIEVVVGESSKDRIEINSGIDGNETIATGAAIGYLFPDFKAAQADD